MTSEATPLHPFLNELTQRGLLHQATNLEGLSAHLATSRSLYGGFDPTKDSLTIGNFVALTLLRRFQLAGHRPFVLVGGGTGLIGDPSGKDAERQLNSREVVEANIEGQKKIFESVLDFDGSFGARIVNNGDWLGGLGYIEVLRDVGKHFSVNMMIQKDSVKTRLEGRDHGISYTEFSYMILQSYDFAHLSKKEGISLQIGGSDQWGNIVAGVDLTRRLHQTEVFGLTAPLLTKSDGGKFGKTESGAVWLTSKYTSPYAFYQFWINAADEDIGRFLRVFSFKTLEEIEQLLVEHEKDRSARLAQKALAEELTRLLHGEEGVSDARRATEVLFSGQVKELPARLLEEVFADQPLTELPRSRFEGAGIPLIDGLIEVGVVKSKREAREFLGNGAISVNGERMAEDGALTTESLLHGRLCLIRRGKKTWHVIRAQG